ncbi:MAG TPA: DUF512 domain-containing protein [Lachnospiraceae bacterium]|nr:DUF512 domain-containing protein [Lachnospiraceae bacterium]
MEKQHIIAQVLAGSIAEELDIQAGDILLKIDGEQMEDIFDYQFFVEEEYLEVLIRKQNGEEWLLEIDKDADEDLGLVFENGLMDEYRSCRNQCIFCFIDQMPPGMRKTLYFKDDDSRLSFLQGNYVTLTNMSDGDIDRIIKYHLSPINISFQTTNPKLRCMMLNNRFAGEALLKVDRLYEAGITMNGQIVLCKGVNDGAELERSISDLIKYMPCLESVSVVPVGLSKFRDGLYPLEPFTREDAVSVLELIQKWQEEAYQAFGMHFVHASDEFYLLAGKELPQAENYDGYLQLENGVGMLRLLLNEYEEAYLSLTDRLAHLSEEKKKRMAEEELEISLVTGKLAYPAISRMAERIEMLFPKLTVMVYSIRNDFFGERITVAGLLTGQDMIRQLKGKPLGKKLLLPVCTLKSGEQVFLDNVTVLDMEKALQVKIDIVKSSGQDFVNALVGDLIYE